MASSTRVFWRIGSNEFQLLRPMIEYKDEEDEILIMAALMVLVS